VKRSKAKVTRLINAETESVSPTNFKLGRQLEHALSTAMANYKGLVKLGYCTRVAVNRVGHTARFIMYQMSSYILTWRCNV